MKTPPRSEITTRDQKGPSHFTTEYTSPNRNVQTVLKMEMKEVIGLGFGESGVTPDQEM
jgi:hypothetical protein